MKVASSAVSNLRRLFAGKAFSARDRFLPHTPVSFSHIERQARAFADAIEERFEKLADILLRYESYEVVRDETDRALDILRSLHENSTYFQLRVGEIASFLPRNQPLYSLSCFVIVPSFMASKVFFRIPSSMRDFFPEMLALLEVQKHFSNISVSHQQRLEFLRERSAVRVNPSTNETIPVTDAVIFTGLPVHAEQLRVVFDDRTLFIANGAGHNPVVVAPDADIQEAVDAVLTLQLYNQGQDCAAPNAILVHRDIFSAFAAALHEHLRKVGVGNYEDRSCRVGPISDPDDVLRVQEFLVHHRQWLDPLAPGVIRARDAIVEPTVIQKPLREGGNFTEIFAPVIFLQEYENDAELGRYFEDVRYAQNAMYISLYGTSEYVMGLVDKQFDGRILHDRASILLNTHPHARGVERGTLPYGGYGYHTSSVTVGGKTICKPTLPQRDIYECIAKPLLELNSLEKYRAHFKKFTKVKERHVEKLLRLVTHKEPSEHSATLEQTYIDVSSIARGKSRYAKIDEEHTYQLLPYPNVEYIARLKLTDLDLLRALRKLLLRRDAIPEDEFSTLLYALAAKPGTNQRENRAGQHDFFQHIYQLLLGKKSGPRLPQFLKDADIAKLQELLDV